MAYDPPFSEVKKKAETLYRAYEYGTDFMPFEVRDYCEAKLIKERFQEILVNNEGFGGYKLSFTTYQSLKKFGLDEPEFAVLTSKMVTEHRSIESPFTYTYVEAELIAEVENCDVNSVNSCVKSLRLGLEIPATRFQQPINKLTTYHLIADNLIAWRLFLGVQVDSEPKRVALLVNDREMGEGAPFYVYGTYKSMLKWLSTKLGRFSGYVATGAILGPVPVKRGDIVTVKSDKGEFTVAIS
jgi:2-keto-4-pentenoate hydratase